MKIYTKNLFFLITITLCVQLSECLVREERFKTNYKLILLDSFGFLPKGSIEFKSIVEPNSTEITLLVCNQKNYEDLFTYGKGDLCSTNIANSTCERVFQHQHNLQFDYEVQDYGVYYLLLVNCIQETISVTANYVFLNPKGQHLDFGHIPLPALFTILSFMWSLITVSWVYNWVKHRSQKSKLHRIISIFPVWKIVWCIYSLYYWSNLSQTGITSISLLLFWGFISILFKAIFFTILILIATGYGITKDKLGSDKIIIPLIIGGLVLSLLATFILSGLFELLTSIIYVVIIIKILRSINVILNELSVDDNSDINSDSLNVAAEKEKLLRTFKIIFISYLAATMVILLIHVLFLVNYYWTAEFLREILELLIFISIAWTLRLRPINIYYRLSNEEIHQNQVEMT